MIQNLEQWQDACRARYASAERYCQMLKDHYDYLRRLGQTEDDAGHYLEHVRKDLERLATERPCPCIIERFGYLAHEGIKKEIPQISPDTTIREIEAPKGTRTIVLPTGSEIEFKVYRGGIVFPPDEPITEQFVAAYDAATDMLWFPTFVVTPEQEQQELIKAFVTLARLKIEREWAERGRKRDDEHVNVDVQEDEETTE